LNFKIKEIKPLVILIEGKHEAFTSNQDIGLGYFWFGYPKGWSPLVLRLKEFSSLIIA